MNIEYNVKSLSLLEMFTFPSESYEQNFEQTYEHSNQQHYESNMSLDKPTGNISSKTDQLLYTSTMKTLQRQSRIKHSYKTYRIVIKSWKITKKQRNRSKSTRISKAARPDRETSRLLWKKILNLFYNKNKQLRAIWDLNHIVNSVPHSSVLKKISSFDYCNYMYMYLETRMHRSKPVGITCAKGSRFYFAVEYVYVFKTRTGRIKRHLKYQLSFMMNLYMLFNVIQ